MTVTPLCAACAYHQRVIRRQIALNQKRIDMGRPADLSLIRRAMQDQESCSRCHPQDGEAG